MPYSLEMRFQYKTSLETTTDGQTKRKTPLTKKFLFEDISCRGRSKVPPPQTALPET